MQIYIHHIKIQIQVTTAKNMKMYHLMSPQPQTAALLPPK